MDNWQRLEELLRRVIREELPSLGKKKPQIKFELGKWTGISEEHLSSWREAYPAVDIPAELKRAAAWIVSNPSQAPHSQVGRFLNSWLAKAQNQASIRSIPNSPPRRVCSYCGNPSTGSVNGYEHCAEHKVAALENRKPAA